MASDLVTRAELDAALPFVLAAPKSDAPIASLCFRPGRGERLFPATVTLTRDKGIPGERWLTEPWMRLPDGSPHPGIQVSILPRRVADLAWRNRTSTLHPGDTIIADIDCSVTNLPIGARIQAGSAVLEVSEVPNYACAKWKVRYGDASYDWIRDPAHADLHLRGVLCAIVQDGEVRLTDHLQVLTRP